MSFNIFLIKALLFILFGLLFFIELLGEGRYVDSLINRYEESILNSENDTVAYELCYNISYYTNKPEVGLKYCNLAYTHSVKCRNKKWQAASKFLESYPHVGLGMLDKAISSLLQAKQLYSEVNSPKGMASCILRLGSVYQLNQEFNLAECYYKNAISKFLELGDSIRVTGAFINLGELFRNIEKLDSALHYFKLAQRFSIYIEEDSNLAYSYGNIGLVYTTQNKLDSAEIFLNKSIEILEPLEDNYAVSSYLDGLAEVYFKRGHYKKAQQTARKSLQLAQDHGLKEQIRDASLRLSTIYNQSNEFEKAFYHHKQYVAYRDSINNEETIRKIANLNTKYEVAQKQKEVDRAESDKERYAIIATTSFSVIGLLLVLGCFVIKVSRERKRVNKTLDAQKQELEEANATKNKFFSILSHDLRSPLSTFHSYIEVMDLCLEANDFAKVGKISKEMRSSNNNLLDLLDNLLHWGVNQMGTAALVPVATNLKETVLGEVKHLQHVAHKKNIVVNAKINDSITLLVDRVRLAMAIRNLINNAIKFTPSGGSVSISGQKINSKPILKITDTGVGMPSEQAAGLFNFKEVSSTYGTQNEKGVGLGLQLVCEFVKSSGARITVDSEPGKGTCFTITFEDKEKGECV